MGTDGNTQDKAGQKKTFDRTRLPLVGEDHPLGPLRRLGRFEWEKVIRRSRFSKSSVKLIALSLATYAAPKTGADVRPGVARLTAVTGLGDSQVRRNLKDLERAGMIFMVASGSSYGRGRKGAASDYQLTAPEVLAELYEAEQAAGTWDELEQFDMEFILKHSAPSTGDSPQVITDHRYPSTGDKDKILTSWGRSPVLQERSPVLEGDITGTPVPPKSPRPHQATSHQSFIGVTLGDIDARDETPNEKALSLEDERQRQMAALQKRIEQQESA